MPRRSFLIASHQIVALGGERRVLGLDLAQFFLGAQVDRAQPLALAAQPLELFLDLGQLGQRLALLRFRRVRRPPAGSISSMSWISRPMSASRRLAPSKRSSARASSSRAALAASSAARASRSASASAFSASCRRSAQARRAASAVCDFADQGLRAFRRKPAARFPARRGRAWLPRCAARAWRSGCARRRGARSSRSCRRRAAASRRSASSASRTIACCSARTSASLARLAGDVVAHARRACFRDRRRAQARRAPRSACGLGGGRLVAAGGQARARFGQRRQPRRLAVEVALARAAFRASVWPAASNADCARPRAPCVCRRPRRGRSPIRCRSRQSGCAAPAAARRRSARAPPRRSRPSATDRPRARPAAGRP